MIHLLSLNLYPQGPGDGGTRYPSVPPLPTHPIMKRITVLCLICFLSPSPPEKRKQSHSLIKGQARLPSPQSPLHHPCPQHTPSANPTFWHSCPQPHLPHISPTHTDYWKSIENWPPREGIQDADNHGGQVGSSEAQRIQFLGYTTSSLNDWGKLPNLLELSLHPRRSTALLNCTDDLSTLRVLGMCKVRL